nr:hypothetical protein [Ardenticatenales bacterium]
VAQARSYHRAGLEVNQKINDRLWIGCGLVGVAALEMAQDPSAATRLLGATARLLESTGMSLERAYGVLYEQSLAALRATLDAETFATAWGEGQALSLDDAIAAALG